MHTFIAAREPTCKREIATIIKLSLLVIASFSLFSTCVRAGGIGVSPPEITVYDALREGEYRRRIKVFNAVENATTFLLEAIGEIGEWVSFYLDEALNESVQNVTVSGNSDATVFVVFRVPSGAPNGNYTGKIYVQTLPKEAGGIAGTSVIISAAIRAFVEVVGTQVLAGEVRSITAKDTEVGYLLSIKVDFRNTGNVDAEPEIRTVILRDGVVMDNFTQPETRVKAGLRSVIAVGWNTTGKEPGDYTGNVTVSLGGDVLMEKSLQFEILPVGTLTRKGELVGLSFEGKNWVGIVLKIYATFRNTGLIDTTAHFVGEAYKDDNLIDVIESSSFLVEVGAEKDIISYFKLTEEGQYNIRGYVVYDGKQTDVKELLIEAEPQPVIEEQTETVIEPEKEGNPNTINVSDLGLIAVIIGIPTFAIYYIRKRKR